MEGVGAGAEKHIKDTAASSPDLCVVGVGLDLHILDRFDGGNHDWAIVGIRDRNAIHKIKIGRDRATGHRGLRRAVLIGETNKLLVACVDEGARDLRGHV